MYTKSSSRVIFCCLAVHSFVPFDPFGFGVPAPNCLLVHGGPLCPGNKHFMTDPKENSEFCFPETLNIS